MVATDRNRDYTFFSANKITASIISETMNIGICIFYKEGNKNSNVENPDIKDKLRDNSQIYKKMKFP